MLDEKCFCSLVGMTTCLLFSGFAVCCVASKFVKSSLLKKAHRNDISVAK